MIENVRKVVKYFKSSSFRNNVLTQQMNVMDIKEIQLLQDTRTRWDSLCTMHQRFLKLYGAIRLALLGTVYLLDDINIDCIEQITGGIV